MPIMSINKFIDVVILDEINRAINVHKLYYLGFILVATAIEFVGALLDEDKFNADGKSAKRFNALINEYFPKEYREHTGKNSDTNLYKNLRCGMVHFFCPDVKVSLTHRKESEYYGTKHLELDGAGSLVLVVEELYNDLCKAIEKIRNDENRSKVKKPLSQPFLSVPEKITAKIHCSKSTPTSGS